MSRRYLTQPLPPPGEHRLPDAIAHHIAVLRPSPGDLLRLCDGAGREVEAEVLAVDRRRLTVRVAEPRAVDNRLPTAIELAIALPKGRRADWLFEHATELGVASFRPLICARSTRTAGGDSLRARRLRVIAAATEQCDRSHLPTLHPETSLEAWLAADEFPAARFVAALGTDLPLAPTRAPHAVLVVGPEGGLTEDELGRLATHGFTAVGLGPLTLRVETAALVGAARLTAPAS